MLLRAALVGIMPRLRALQQRCEAATGAYPVTMALLDLAASLLGQGYSKVACVQAHGCHGCTGARVHGCTGVGAGGVVHGSCSFICRAA